MKRRATQNRILALVLLLVLMIGCMVQPTSGKYVLTDTGRAMTSVISANVFTDVFVVTNSDLENGSATSNSLHGVGIIENDDGVLTVPKNADTYANSLDSTVNLSFVIKNNSSYDLVACFDIILCMGEIDDGVLTCTITAPSSTAESDQKTQLILNASLEEGEDIDIVMKAHKESENDKNGDVPVINVEYSNTIFGFININYSAYSFQIDPTEYLLGEGVTDNDSTLTKDEFNSFILIPAGATRTFEFSVTADERWLANFAKNAFAQITMTAKIDDTKAE